MPKKKNKDSHDFGFKPGAEKFPLMVVVATSYKCNSRCPHCPYTETVTDIRKNYTDAPFIPFDLFKKVADECAQNDSFIRLTAGGEPLVHPRMVEMIEYAKKAGAKVGLTTNGSLLTSEKADRLLAAGIDAIEFSVDAADKDTYGKIRVGLNYDKLLNNVKYAVKKRNELKSPTRIVASVINQKLIKGKVRKITGFWNKIVDHVIVRKYLTWDVLDPKNSADPVPFINKDIPCPFPFERLVVDTRGKIVLCPYDIYSTTDFGNIKNTTIAKAWKGKKFQEIRDLHLGKRGDEIKLCSTCSDWLYRSWDYNYWHALKTAEKKRNAGKVKE